MIERVVELSSYFDKHIVAMHFYHNIVFIRKGLKHEKTNHEVHQR